MFWVRLRFGGLEYRGVLDTGATISIVAKKILPEGFLKNTVPTAAIRVGDVYVVYSCGDTLVDVPMGSRDIAHRFYVMDREAFDFVLGTDLFRAHPQVQSLTLQSPYVLCVDHGNGRESVSLEHSDQVSRHLRIAEKIPTTMLAAARNEDYQLLREVLDQGLRELGYSMEDLRVELFASDKQHVLDVYCSPGVSSSYKFYWPSFILSYGNPRFSELGKVLTKVAYERARMVICTPDWGACGKNAYWRTLLRKLTLTSVNLPDDAIYVPLGKNQPLKKPGWGSMLSVVDGALAPVPWEELDSKILREIQNESKDMTLEDLTKMRQPPDAIEVVPGGDEYVVTAEPNPPHREPVVANPDVYSECGLSELPSSIHSGDEREHDAFYVQTYIEELDQADEELRCGEKPLFSMRRETFTEGLDHQGRQKEYMDSKRRLVAAKLNYARPSTSSWPIKQGEEGDLRQLKESLDQRITTWQREVELKRMKSVWGAHVRTPDEDELSRECLCEPPRACACCPSPTAIVERDLLYAYQGLKEDKTEPVEDHLPASIHMEKGASNLHSDADLEDKIQQLDPRVQKLIRTYREVFGELPPPASCEKLVQMDLKLKPEFKGHKIGGGPTLLPKSRLTRSTGRYKNVSMPGSSWSTRTGTTPPTAVLVSWLPNQGPRR